MYNCYFHITSICLIYQVFCCSPPIPNPLTTTRQQIPNKIFADKTYQQQNKASIRFNDRVSVLSGPIRIPEELNCYDFNDECRWRNMEGLLVDELDWYQGAGVLDENRLRLATGTHLTPDGFYGIAASDKVEFSGTKAILVSDVIECQNGPANLRFQHWTSPEVRIIVCVKSVLRFFPYFDYCSKPVENDPGPVFLTIPELNAPMQIFIQAHNFVFNNVALHGGFAIIDNLEYFGEFCGKENDIMSSSYNASDSKNPHRHRADKKLNRQIDTKSSTDNSYNTNGFPSIFDWIFRNTQEETLIKMENETRPYLLQNTNKTFDKTFNSTVANTYVTNQYGLRSIHILQRTQSSKLEEQDLFPNTWKNFGSLKLRRSNFKLGLKNNSLALGPNERKHDENQIVTYKL